MAINNSSNGSNSEDSNNNGNNNGSGSNLVSLILTEQIQKEEIVSKLAVNKKTKCIIVELNHIYGKKTIVSPIYRDWNEMIDSFSDRAKKKGVDSNHICMLTDTLDDNNEKVMECFFSSNSTGSNGITGDLKGDNKDAAALELAKSKIAELFLDEVKIPYAAIKEDEHIETIPIDSTKFEDWIGAAYYNHANETEGGNSFSVLSKESISKIQSILRYQANSNKQNIRTLHLRVASFVDSECTNLDDNAVYYDLYNPNREIIKVTRHSWTIEKNHVEILFKRFNIMNAQVYPIREYPEDILEQFLKLTNVYNDDDNKILATVYLISLFMLANLPKPMLLPHGTHGSAKSTFQEFIKLIVDPSAALTTAFPNNLAELVQELSHSYLTFFDNVSEISQITSDQLCRAVTGSGFQKRLHYTNDDDMIYNMKRAVGYNGINVTATRADLLDRILSLHLKPIDRRQRRKSSVLYKEFNNILPCLLGYIFDVIVKVLNRIGEVKLEELPRMADFAEMGELISRCVGYPNGKFTDAYNRNIGFTNEEAIDANPIATAIRILMTTQAVWSGKSEDLRLKLNDMVYHKRELSGMIYSKGWPKTPHALSDRVNEVTPNLKEIGIIIHREYDRHTKSGIITIVNNNYIPQDYEIDDEAVSSDKVNEGNSDIKK
jgi:hypothetical protein